MDGFRDFTLDKLQYSAPKMQEFLGQLHRAGRHWVPIVDPGIMIDPGYPAYDAGLKADVFLKGMDQKPYVGQVRCTDTTVCMVPVYCLLIYEEFGVFPPRKES